MGVCAPTDAEVGSCGREQAHRPETQESGEKNECRKKRGVAGGEKGEKKILKKGAKNKQDGGKKEEYCWALVSERREENGIAGKASSPLKGWRCVTIPRGGVKQKFLLKKGS